MPDTTLRELLTRVATDPEFAAAVSTYPDLLRSKYGLSPPEAGVVAAAVIDAGGPLDGPQPGSS